MASLLDAPKPTAKVEEYVERQLAAARRRVRVLDFFLVGLVLAVGSLAFLLGVLLVDRYVETPRGTGWAVLAGYLVLAALFLYRALFRPERRSINPYFAARQVEQNVPDAKNSLVTYVDLEDDQKLPGSIRNAISTKAARDLRKVDLNRAIENRKIIWLAGAAGVLLLANVVVGFLSPTRTELSLEQPKNGDVTVFNNQEVTFDVRVRGRVPGPNDPDAVRLRMWYNPDDPETYEERPLKVAEGDRRQFSITVPPRQVRNGFRYRILAGNTQTPEYTVTCKIIPEFTGFDVGYQYPAYLKREAESNNDPNLVGPYGTVVTLTVGTNREVKHGHIEIEGQARTIDGKLVEGRPDAIQFTLPLEKEGFYRIWYTTPEGDKNQDPARLRLTVIDPRPAFRSFDVAYEYPAYLRFKPMTAAEVREPVIEAQRGTRVVLTARTTRGVKDAKFEVDGLAPVAGEPVPDQPTWVLFRLPAIDKDATARVTFTPTTNEPAGAPRSIPVRVLVDQVPTVKIDVPEPKLVELPANGTLDLRGLATDDHGVDRLTLRMKVAGTDQDLKPKPYRNGMSFLRKDDNSWPTKVKYKDFVKLPEVRFEREPNRRVTPGLEIEYWLEAQDNCGVEPGPNVGQSAHKRFKVIAPKAEEPKKLDEQNQKRDKDQRAHEKRQDEQNKTEKRDVQQPPPQGAQDPAQQNQEPGGTPERKNGDPNGKPPQGDPMGTPQKGADGNPQEANPQGGNPPNDDRTDQVEKAIQKADEDKAAGGSRTGPASPDAQVDPGEARQKPGMGPMDPPPAEDHKPKTDPNQDMTGDGAAGGSRGGKVDNSRDEKAETKDEGTPPAGGMPEEKSGDKRADGGASAQASQGKPDPKQPKTGTPESKGDRPEKGSYRPDTARADQKDPNGGSSTAKGDTKPEKDVTPAEDKGADTEPTPMGGTKPPSDAAAEKPRTAPEPGGSRPQPKKDELTEQGGTRGGPKDEGAAGDERPQPKNGGMNDEVAKGGSKGGPGSPGQNQEQGDLDRELGELEREINSPNPKMDPRKQSDVDHLMRDKKTREKTREKLEELERNGKDQLTRDKARQARQAGEQAAKNYDNEKPNEDNMDRLSKNLKSEDQREREEAQQRLKDWQNNPETKKDLEDQADRLAKKDPKAGERVKDAMDKNERAGNQAANAGEQKMNEKDLQQMAKDLNGSDPKAKADAKQKLEEMMKDPKTRQQAQDKLKEMANKAQGQDRQDLDNAARQAGQMADQMAGKEPQPKKPTPQDLKDAADKLAKGTEQEKKEAMDRLKDIAKDPKAAEEARRQLEQMAKDAKTPEDKKALEDAAKAAGDLAKGNQPQPNEKDLKDAADKLANGTEKEKQEATDRLKEMARDPKTAREAQDKLREMARNARSDQERKNLEDAANKAEQLAKENGPKDKPGPKPQDMKDLAGKLAGKDDKAKEDARKQLEEMMKDPKAREEALKQLEEMAKNAKPEDKQALQEALKQANEMAKNQPQQKPDPKNLKELADQLSKMSPEAKEKLREEMQEAMKDPKTREEMQKLAKEMAKQPKTPEEQRKWDELMNQLGGDFQSAKGTPDPADPRNKLKSAELLLEQFNKNRAATTDRLGWTDEQVNQWIKDQEATIAALRKQVEKGDWGTDRTRVSPNRGGPDRITLDPKNGGNLQRGGTAPPPPGYVDPYGRFTKEEAGGGRVPEPKR